MDCFRCAACEKQLIQGDEFSLRHDELFCKDDSLEMLANAKKETIENNNNNILQQGHNTSNSSEDNSEGKRVISKLTIYTVHVQ